MPSHETAAENLKLIVYLADGRELQYTAWISPARRHDLILKVPPADIILFGARDWIAR